MMPTKTVLETLEQPRKNTFFTFVSSTGTVGNFIDLIVLNKSLLVITYCLIIF